MSRVESPEEVPASGFRGSWKHALLLLASILGVVEYGLVLMFGSVLESLQTYYDISETQADFLYTMCNIGACALSFVAGVIFDRWGAEVAMIVGTVTGAIPLVLQLVWANEIPSWIGTMKGLSTIYLLFGMSATVFNVVGCFAPLAAFSEANAGKVGAIVQVCLSLGMSFQNSMFGYIQNTGGAYVMTYTWYTLSFTVGSGFLMLLALKQCRSLLQPAQAQEECSKSFQTVDSRSLRQLIASKDFTFMAAVFICGIGFSFSFFDYEAKIAAATGANLTLLWNIFGVVNALARLVTGLALDFTRHMRFGGPPTYIVASLMIFAIGLLCLVFPSNPDAATMQISNALVALGYGGMMGMVPIALRLHFGTAHLGLLCGILYALVSVAQPIWSLLAHHSSDCVGVGCYTAYTAGGAAGCTVAALVGCGLMVADSMKQRNLSRSQSDQVFLEDPSVV